MTVHPGRFGALAALVVSGFLISDFGGGRIVQAAEPGAERQKDTIVMGRVSSNPRKTYPKIERFVGYLAHKLRPLGISRGAVRIARNNKEMIELLRAGDVDFISETIMSALLMAERAGAEILLREWKKKRGWYWSIIIARPESGIKTLADLRGHKIAFEDRGSTASFLVPLALIRRQGLKTVHLESHTDPVPADTIGYVFAGKEINITAWVERKLVAAGALSNWDFLGKARAPRVMRQDLSVVYKSRPFIRSVFMARAGVSETIKRRVKEILLRMNGDPAAKPILKNYYKVKKYDEIEGEAAESLEESRKLYSLIRDRIG